MNLATARSSNKAKEVGIRKTAGALRGSLVKQFFIESLLFSFISTLLSLLLIFAILPFFNALAGKQLSIHIFQQAGILSGLIGMAMVVGFLAGSYPALYLTSFKPVEVLKGKVRAGVKSSGIRSGLVVFQFTISIGLIICTFIGVSTIVADPTAPPGI